MKWLFLRSIRLRWFHLPSTDYRLQSRRGFTLIEMMLVIALIASMFAVSAPVYLDMQKKNNLDTSVNGTVESIKRAQDLARFQKEDTDWGVKLETDKITVYKGNNFLARDVNFDEIVVYESPISVSGNTDFYFNRFTGVPNISGDIILSDAQSRTININAKGVINY